jgi:hypothetical protein
MQSDASQTIEMRARCRRQAANWRRRVSSRPGVTLCQPPGRGVRMRALTNPQIGTSRRVDAAANRSVRAPRVRCAPPWRGHLFAAAQTAGCAAAARPCARDQMRQLKGTRSRPPDDLVRPARVVLATEHPHQRGRADCQAGRQMGATRHDCEPPPLWAGRPADRQPKRAGPI